MTNSMNEERHLGKDHLILWWSKYSQSIRQAIDDQIVSFLRFRNEEILVHMLQELWRFRQLHVFRLIPDPCSLRGEGCTVLIARADR